MPDRLSSYEVPVLLLSVYYRYRFDEILRESPKIESALDTYHHYHDQVLSQ